nr:ribonuclease H-like domain, reverse transcriptase, RNA-dependent DNA polymerase [Tanacetum cinerariifolium]
AGTQDNVNSRKEVFDQHYIVLPLWSSISSTFKSSDEKATDDKPTDDTGSKTVEEPVNKEDQAYRDELDRLTSQERRLSSVNAASTSGTFSAAGLSSPHPDAFIPTNTLLHVDQDDSQIPDLEDTVYVGDIIFGSIKKSLCDEFEALMHKIFQMSSMEELTFFLGLQVKQSEEGIFISQD